LAIAQNAAAIQLPTPSDPEPPEELTGGTSLPGSDARAIDEVLETLRARTRHDFSNYKRGTVMRRIERRMQVNAMPTAVAYRDFLDGNLDETPKLLADMLIGVTNFFRDPHSFAALERTVLPQLLANLQGRDELRAWVPACATGEEAYSIAILLDEAIRRLPNRPRVIVYASDIGGRAISIARTAEIFKLVVASTNKYQAAFLSCLRRCSVTPGLSMRSGFRCTVSTRCQLRVGPFHRSGLRCLAAW
jgi:two-component system CheB/CheR fusion protein